MPSIKIKDLNMYYEIHGEGRPMVLIEGLGTDMRPYMKVVERFCQRRKVLIFDNRGVGRTDKPDMPYTMDMMVEDTAGLMEAVGIEKADIVGFSMGGRIAMALALRHPGMVRSLALASTTAKTRRKDLPSRSKLVKMIRSIRLFGDGQQPYYAFKRQLEVSRHFDCSDQLPRIQVPTLILHGKDDRLVPLSLAEELHAGIKGSEMRVFDGGHAFFFWDARRFVDAVSEFLTGTG